MDNFIYSSVRVIFDTVELSVFIDMGIFKSYSFFIGHLIIYPYKTSDTVLGFSMTADAAAGYYYTDIYDVFDTLQVSPEYKVTETNYSGSADRRITVK